MASYFTPWTQVDHQKSTERTGKGLSTSLRLIQKICEVKPITCLMYKGGMRIIAFIEDSEVIKKILKHLDLWNVKAQSLPRAYAPPHNIEPHLDYSGSQIPPSFDALYGDESQ